MKEGPTRWIFVMLVALNPSDESRSVALGEHKNDRRFGAVSLFDVVMLFALLFRGIKKGAACAAPFCG
jgi:hypothetical protein